MTAITSTARRYRDLDSLDQVFTTPAVRDWHPAFGTLSPKTAGAIGVLFTPEEVRRLQFATYLAARYEINEGYGVSRLNHFPIRSES